MTRHFGDGDNSIWKKVGEDAVKTAVNTLIEEGIEATVEIWKKRRLKMQEEEIEEMAADQEKASAQAPDPGERKPYPGDGESEEASDDEPVDEPDDDEGQEAASLPHDYEEPAAEAGASVESFGTYVARAKGDTDE